MFRGTEEYCGVEGKVDVINSTFGKALGGAAGQSAAVLFHFLFIYLFIYYFIVSCFVFVVPVVPGSFVR